MAGLLIGLLLGLLIVPGMFVSNALRKDLNQKIKEIVLITSNHLPSKVEE